MKTKILILFVLFTSVSFSQKNDSTKNQKYISISAGFAQHVTPAAFLKCSKRFTRLQPGLGYSFQSSHTSFDSFSKLKYQSHILFTDLNVFINRNFYVGALLGLSLNFVDANSQKEYTSTLLKESPTYSTGTYFCGQLGYHLPLTKSISFFSQAHVGINSYLIAPGAVYFSTEEAHSTSGVTEEYHRSLIYNISLGFNFRL